MSAPVFDFTDRAIPIVQMGRPEFLEKGEARWGRAHWGVDTWSRTLWKIVWSDVTCEIHEVTVDTGRNEATDRFKPATAEIVASNVNELTDFIFPDLPPSQPLEFLPREPTPSDTLPGELNLITSWSDSGDAADSFTISPPAGIQVGDVLYIQILANLGFGSGTNPSKPFLDDWTWINGNYFNTDTANPETSDQIMIRYDHYFHRVVDVGASWVCEQKATAAWQYLGAAVRGVADTLPHRFSVGSVIYYPHDSGSPTRAIPSPATSPAPTVATGVLRWMMSAWNYTWPSAGPPGTYELEHVAADWGPDQHLLIDGTSDGFTLVPAPGPTAKDYDLGAVQVAGRGDWNMGSTIAVIPGSYTPPPVPPPPMEEAGMQVRIGVDHAELGECWLFHGYVDAMTPTYVPDRDDAVRIECIDALGEAGRQMIQYFETTVPRYSTADERIRQVLDAASWPRKLRDIEPDDTVMTAPSDDRAVDSLTRIAESCGGAVYGDPTTNHVVFRPQDWQAEPAAGPPDAYITNYRPDEVTDGKPRVCPTGWEMSWRRSDSTTRAYFNNEEGLTKGWRAVVVEEYFGIEDYETTLLCVDGERLNDLAIRHIRIRNPRVFPRVEAVLIDASTEDAALDLMATATFTGPSVYRCQLRRDDRFVFDGKYLVVGIRHRMQPHQWTCRLALCRAVAFAEYGGHWGIARWGVDSWGRGGL